MDDSTEAHDDGCLHAGSAEHVCTGQVGDVVRDLLQNMSAGAQAACCELQARQPTSKKPLALAPLACTTRSGMRSRSNCRTGRSQPGHSQAHSSSSQAWPAATHLGNLLDELIVLQEHRAAAAHCQRAGVVPHGCATAARCTGSASA